MKKLLLASVLAIVSFPGYATPSTEERVCSVFADKPKLERLCMKRLTNKNDPVYKLFLGCGSLECFEEVRDAIVREEWKTQCAKGDQDACNDLCHAPEDNCDAQGRPPARGAHAKKPLTLKQIKDYKDLRSIGISKKEARRVARDPGVKKGEWGWICEVDPAIRVYKAPGVGAKYKRNAVCE
jgi:hypothetical protein